MKILWVSNGRNAPSGYGNQTNLFTPLLKQAGHEVAIFAFYGQEVGAQVDPDGIVTLPRVSEAWGNDVIQAHADWFGADIVITLCNPWVLDPGQYNTLNWLAWTPIEGEPMRPHDANVLRFAKRVWAMSKHGEKQCWVAGFADNTDYVPHGVDTETFKPIDRGAARERLNKLWNDAGRWRGSLDGKYIVAYNAANKGIPSRKGFYECMAAFAEFKRQFGPEALLYLHTERDGRLGEPLLDVMKLANLTERDVIFAPQHAYVSGMLSPKYLNEVYNAADVYLHTSHGEGFGIPIVEAQAAGCPVVVNGYGTMRELVFEGYMADPIAHYQHQPGMLFGLPSIPALANMLLLSATDAVHGREYQSEFAQRGALAYDFRRVAREYMLPAIERFVAERDNREAERKAKRERARALSPNPSGSGKPDSYSREGELVDAAEV